MMHLALSAVLALPFVGAQYSYNRCNATYGPAAWGGACKTGVQGSPINVCGGKPFASAAPTWSNVVGYSDLRDGAIFNNGHTIEVTISSTPSRPSLQLGNISSIVGRSSNSTVFTWNLQQIHFHWGRTGKVDEGSEHYLFGERFPIEAHFVHWNSKYPDFNAAVQAGVAGSADALLVAGVFFKIDTTDVDFMVKVAQNVTSLRKSPQTLGGITLSDVFNGAGHYHSYAGSLTTPTCLEIVTWVVMTATKPITLNTLNKIKMASEFPPASTKFAIQAEAETISLYGNYRPIQPIGSRTVWASDAANPGPACAATVSHPVFNCNSNSASQIAFSPIILLFSLISFMLSGL